jgi:nucleoside-diphosphate-sugar epimerase
VTEINVDGTVNLLEAAKKTDVVDANQALLELDAADGDVLNIGSSDNILIQELDRGRSGSVSARTGD